MTAARSLEPEARFPLPEKALSMHALVLAKTRSGKSSTLRLIVEHGLDQGIPVCIIDPKGDWWGIKSSANGKAAGYPVVIFGGEHADLPLKPEAGAAIADLIATGNRPALIDLGGAMPSELTRFWINFAPAFFRLTRGRRWLVIDECHNFAPQGKVLDPDSGKMLHWSNRIANEAGGKGVTLFSASQRPQKVHKDYATAHETLIALRSVHPLDKGAVQDWMSGHDPAKAKEIVASLHDLDKGEAWVWSPEARFGPKRLQFPKFSTYDSFAAPTGNEHVAKLKGWASIDLDDVKAKLAAVVEEAKANDPRELKAQVAKLQRELAAAQKHPAAALVAPADPAVLESARAKAFEAGFSDGFQTGHQQGVSDALERTRQAIEGVQAKLPPARTPKAIAPPAHKPAPAPHKVAPVAHKVAPKADTGARDGDYTLVAGQRKILEAVSFWEALGIPQPTRIQAASACSMTADGGTFKTYAGKLISLGLLSAPMPGHVALTDDGRSQAPAPDIAQSARDRVGKILVRGQAAILDALPQDGSEVARDELAPAVDMTPDGGTFKTYMGKLISLGIARATRPGFVAVADWVWSR